GMNGADGRIGVNGSKGSNAKTKRADRFRPKAGKPGKIGKRGDGGQFGHSGTPGTPGGDGASGSAGSPGGGAIMLRTWSATGSILIGGGSINVSATIPGPTPGAGGGAGGSIVLISPNVTLSGATLRANGASASGGGGRAGKIAILSSSLTTNVTTTVQAMPGAGAGSPGGVGGLAGAGGGAGAAGFGGQGGAGGLGGVGGAASVNPNQGIGGKLGKGGAGGLGGLGGKPGPCFWWPCFWFVYDGSWWHYWDFGTFPGLGWNLPEYDDSNWRTGTNSFGYGDSHDTTIMTSNTCYFRQAFEILDPNSITNLVAFVRRDDGVVLYLNGQEVFRDNMTTNVISHTTPALTGAPDDGARVLIVEIPPHIYQPLLRYGTNVIAAEVHQATGVTNRADMSFQLRLMANGLPRYPQSFGTGYTTFIPQLHTSSNGTPVSELFADVPPGAEMDLFIWTSMGWQMESYSPFMRGWSPGTSVIRPGESALLSNYGPPFNIEIVGYPHEANSPVVINRNQETLVGEAMPGGAVFEDLAGHAPENGTTLTRYVAGVQADYSFVNDAWMPQEPVLAPGEAAFITLPCLTVTAPSNVVLEAVSPMGAQMTTQIAATNHCGDPLMVQYAPPPGTWLPLGMHPVNYQVFAGLNHSSGMILVQVTDTTPPEIFGATDRVFEAPGPQGVVIPDYGVTVSDSADPLVQLSVTPPPGSLFPPGTTLVQCTATDASGNTSTAEFMVTVTDTLAPQITCPPSMTLVKNTADGADLIYTVLTFDSGDTNVMLECSVPSGSVVSEGTTTVECRVMDESGNLNSCSFQVQVVAAEPGEITGFDASVGTVNMSFPTQLGVEYAIEYKNSLDEPDWQPLTFVTGNGSPMEINDPAPDRQMRFYRVRSP
ncbi:MAG: HYR domain-containing protein, partial [Verrucomicrobia bacterium]|nr:HYR domain-containing protein [Verrucomicrobiota bacterium]